jgi:predicted AAA+ superfamily ATPase
MNFIERNLKLSQILKHKSAFLFGPRQTGKSILIRSQLSQLEGVKTYNLLDRQLYSKLVHNPSLIRQELTPKDKIIVIDEFQKIPEILDEVHLMIEEHNIRFLLTGSSSRALKRRGVNLLGGRAHRHILYPFSWSELAKSDLNFDLLRALNTGLLPSIYLSPEPEEDLLSYVGDYLKEEIAAEALTRNIGAFSRFLEVAGANHAQMINYTSVANDAGVPVTTVREYFQILKDTFIGSELLAYKQTVKRKPIATSKFYFFDIGVARTLQKRTNLQMGSPEFAEAFESFIFHELQCYMAYKQKKEELTYWRSTAQHEVDFLLGEEMAIEVKGKKNISSNDLKGLKALREEGIFKRYIVVCLEDRPRLLDEIEILPWEYFLNELS